MPIGQASHQSRGAGAVRRTSVASFWRRRAKRGQAMMEFTLIILLMLSMTFGVVEFGRAFHAYLGVTHAARDGARVGMDPAVADGAITSAADAGMHPLNPSDVAIVRTASQVTVTVTYRFESPVPLISQIWGGGPLFIRRQAISRVDPA